MTGPSPISATSLSKQVDVPQATLSKWLRKAGVPAPFEFPDKTLITSQEGQIMYPKRPEDWSSQDKFQAVLDAASLTDEELGHFLRNKGLHETYLQEWKLQMINSLEKTAETKKSKHRAADIRRIKDLEKELKRKDKALAETAALLVLKKKVQEIWGDEEENTIPKNAK